MRVLVFLIFGAATVATPGSAGAWLQDEGKSFLSLENGVRRRAEGVTVETDVYFEYGLSERVSTGLSLVRTGGKKGHASLFLKMPLGAKNKTWVKSLQVDLGAYRSFNQWSGLTKMTVAYGRGFPWGQGYGWINIDGAIEYRLGEQSPFLKIDGTLGQSTGARLRPMLKMSLTQARSKPVIWSVSPYVLIDGNARTVWALGLERKNDGQLSHSLKIGLWRKF